MIALFEWFATIVLATAGFFMSALWGMMVGVGDEPEKTGPIMMAGMICTLAAIVMAAVAAS